MSPLPAGAVLLALCVCSLALVNLDGCKRSFVEVESAMEDEELRELIEKQLGKPLKDDDLITNFLVHDKNTTNSPMCFSSEEMRNEGGFVCGCSTYVVHGHHGVR